MRQPSSPSTVSARFKAGLQHTGETRPGQFLRTGDRKKNTDERLSWTLYSKSWTIHASSGQTSMSK